jgi:cation transport regulator ChaB
MTARDDLPAEVAASSEAAQRAWIDAYDVAIEEHGDEKRARAAADAAWRSVVEGAAGT